MTRRALALALLVPLAPIGCVLNGPKTVEVGRPLYNQAIHQTSNEQLLLNLVRSRYRDGAFFLEVASVSTNFEFEATLDGRVSTPSGLSSTYGYGIEGTALESPTITYTPLAGEGYVKAVLSPINLETLVLLFYSGWNVDRIFRVTLNNLGDARNAPESAGPTPSLAPEFRDFHRATVLLRELQKARKIDFSLIANENEKLAGIGIPVDDVRNPNWQELASALEFPADTDRIRLTLETGEDPRDIVIGTRSFLGCVYYLCNAVNPPLEDEEAGRVTVTRTPTGEVFHWSELLGDLLTIHSCEREPDNAAVAIQHRGTWFYIDDSDLSSKSTFGLLSQLFQLSSGGIPSTGPILTLPVSR